MTEAAEQIVNEWCAPVTFIQLATVQKIGFHGLIFGWLRHKLAMTIVGASPSDEDAGWTRSECFGDARRTFTQAMAPAWLAEGHS